MLEFLPDVNFDFINNVNATMYMIGFVSAIITFTIIGVVIKVFSDNLKLKEENEKLEKNLNDSERTFILGDNLVRKQRERLKHYDDLLAFHSKLTTESRNLLELQQAKIDTLENQLIEVNNVDKIQVGRINVLETHLKEQDARYINIIRDQENNIKELTDKLNATQAQLDLALETIENAGVKPDVEEEDKP